MPLASEKESLHSYRRDSKGLLQVRGGLSIRFGRASFERIEDALQPKRLCYPLTQRGERFIDIAVESGRQVNVGDVLARSDRLVLRAGMPGTISEIVRSKRRLTGYIEVEPSGATSEALPGCAGDAPVEQMRQHAVKRGLWESIQQGMISLPPAIDHQPQAVIVRCVFAEPFVLRGDVPIREHLDDFLAGLKILNRLAGGYAPLLLTVTAMGSALGKEIRERVRGQAFVHLIPAPVRYPIENPLLLATNLGYDHDWGPDAFWVVDPQFVVALNQAFTQGKFWSHRTIAVGGPGVAQPAIVEAPLGTPLRQIVLDHLSDEVSLETSCVLRGSIYSGLRADPDDGLLDRDRTITVIPETERAEFLGWLKPGSDRHSWTKMFASALNSKIIYQARNLLRSDVRPCVQCGFCREVCPAGIYPHHLHRLVKADLLEEAQEAGLLNCVECHCCSYGCVSKLELSRDLVKARRQVLDEEG